MGVIALGDEPEFAGSRFDDEEVVEVTVRYLKRYEARLNALLNRGDRGADRELYDLMRIDVISELVTPEVQRGFQERSRRCRERFGREVRQQFSFEHDSPGDALQDGPMLTLIRIHRGCASLLRRQSFEGPGARRVSSLSESLSVRRQSVVHCAHA